MRKPCRVLVTGAGSGVGQGIVKALRCSNLPVTIITADITSKNVALYRGDEALVIPRVESQDSLNAILTILNKHEIDVVMIGSEFDLSFFSSNRWEIESRSRATVIVAPPETVAIADDKWLTAEFLRKHGLPYGEAYLPASVNDALSLADDWGYPLVIKTRRGTSSRHVYIVNDHNELRKRYFETPLPMLQRMIGNPSSQLGSEYTCSVFKAADGTMIGPFTARRTVKDGTSWHIEVANFETLHAPLLAVANAIDYIGSMNIQLMLTDEDAIPFELNARFSGTTAVRAHFGFNEPAMALLSLFYKEDVSKPAIRSGFAMRYHEEVFIEGASDNNLTPGKQKGTINRWF